MAAVALSSVAAPVATTALRSVAAVNGSGSQSTALLMRKNFLGSSVRSAGLTAAPQKPARLSVRASATEEAGPDVSAIVEDLKAKWEAVENKSTVAVYAGGALVALWLSSTIVGAINSVPLLPKLMELVGLGYTGWFVYRYLLFKSSRKELVSDIEELKSKITGAGKD